MKKRVVIDCINKSLIVNVDDLDYGLGRMKAINDFWGLGVDINTPKTSDACIGYAHKLMQLDGYSFSEAIAIAERVILDE